MAQGPAPLASALISEIPSWHYKAPERNQKGGFSGYIVRKPGDFDRSFFQATQQDGEPRCVAPFGISKPYDAAKDIVFFDARGDLFRVRAGQIAIFAPHDLHAPGLAAGSVPSEVLKVVVKCLL